MLLCYQLMCSVSERRRIVVIIFAELTNKENREGHLNS